MTDQPEKIETDGPRIVEVEHPEPHIIDTDAQGQPTSQPEPEAPGQTTIAELADKAEQEGADAEPEQGDSDVGRLGTSSPIE